VLRAKEKEGEKKHEKKKGEGTDATFVLTEDSEKKKKGKRVQTQVAAGLEKQEGGNRRGKEGGKTQPLHLFKGGRGEGGGTGAASFPRAGRGRKKEKGLREEKDCGEHIRRRREKGKRK